LEKLLGQALRPELTLLLDIDAGTAVHRTGARNRKTHQPDTRFEKEGLEFFERVRNGYLEIARQEPERVRVLDGRASIEEIQESMRRVVDEFLASTQSVKIRETGKPRGL
jgi:dTMP kinase